jgi:periplasmic divalent cation tolerance protein
MEYIEIHSTVASIEVARTICAAVVSARLAACVQVSSPILSSYWWHGKVEQAEEYFVTMKTTRDKFDELALMIRQHHSYELPEIVAVPIVDGTEDYLAWISAETREPDASA